MPLVHVVDVLPNAESLEEKYTTDTEEILLLHTVLPVTTIELVGNGAVPLAVLRDVGIEEVKVNAPNVDLPDMTVDRMGRIGHLQHHRGIPILLEELLER